jgi:hypothetical protein
VEALAAPSAPSFLAVATAEAAGAATGGRGLQGGTVPATLVIASGINITPEVTAGLLIGLVMVFFVLLGLSCIMSINTPDVLHSTALPAGKEY